MELTDVFAMARAIAVANHHPDPDSYAQSAADAYVAPGSAPAPDTQAA